MASYRDERSYLWQNTHIKCVETSSSASRAQTYTESPAVPAILTNIPGPPESAELAGSTILRWTALPPQGAKGTVAVGIITYNGSVSVTIAVDK